MLHVPVNPPTAAVDDLVGSPRIATPAVRYHGACDGRGVRQRCRARGLPIAP
ncbi:hypothetical protein EDC22_102475 [Tepidamorphus gemmatus]|uniref:Uncharacterized protein n=1 Tax=Tepidamorphus gemmatus TaxID=747076 RepID=A0A4R3MHU0_9HYPH|nr:hypothetical protein EDC22_102475 [Tepidamorphus gemmatus]